MKELVKEFPPADRAIFEPSNKYPHVGVLDKKNKEKFIMARLNNLYSLIFISEYENETCLCSLHQRDTKNDLISYLFRYPMLYQVLIFNTHQELMDWVANVSYVLVTDK